MKIINVVARYPGSTHDSYIWENSNLKQLLWNLHNQGHTDYYLLGKHIFYNCRDCFEVFLLFYLNIVN